MARLLQIELLLSDDQMSALSAYRGAGAKANNYDPEWNGSIHEPDAERKALVKELRGERDRCLKVLEEVLRGKEDALGIWLMQFGCAAAARDDIFRRNRESFAGRTAELKQSGMDDRKAYLAAFGEIIGPELVGLREGRADGSRACREVEKAVSLERIQTASALRRQIVVDWVEALFQEADRPPPNGLEWDSLIWAPTKVSVLSHLAEFDRGRIRSAARKSSSSLN